MNGGGSGEQTKAACKRLNEVIDHTKPILYIPIALDESWYPGCMEFITKELADLAGFDVLSGGVLFCHYSGSEESKAYIRELSKKAAVHVLTEDTTLFLNGDKVEVIGKGYFTEV